MSTAIDDDLWSAVGDPTRRRMLDLLLNEGGGTATTLSDQLPVTRQAVAKHLGVLDRVGLVHGSLAGRERRYEVDEVQLSRAVAQLSSVGAVWDARLNRIRSIADPAQPGRLTPLPTRNAATSVAVPMNRARTRAPPRNGNGNGRHLAQDRCDRIA
jgi:DNA-binding transcriptional ArsR family regulator